MALPDYKAADYQAVFEYFGIDPRDRPDKSWYAYAPVFRTTVAGVPAAVKRVREPAAAAAISRWVRALAASGTAAVTPIHAPVQNPGLVGDQNWVAYPWIEGRTYDGSNADIAAAGDLLGRLHARTDYYDAAMPRFKWPEHDEASVEEDVEDLTRVLKSRAPEIAAQVIARTGHWHRAFMTDTLPVIRDASLPFVVGTTDFRASNLVYADTDLVLIDPDNADYLPRILDLAIAALLFHSGLESAPPRMFTQAEWDLFASAYSPQAKLTDLEIQLWQAALKYIVTEWCTWALVASDEWGDWADRHKCGFLTDLAAAELARFPL